MSLKNWKFRAVMAFYGLVLGLCFALAVNLANRRAEASGVQVGSLDRVSRAAVMIEFPHHEIHDGDHFAFNDFSAVASGANRDYLVITPATTRWAHLILQMATNQGGIMHLFEDATTSANGTPITAFNNNRNSGTAATVLVFHTPTVTTTGTEIATFYMTLDSGAARVGVQSRNDDEFILKQNSRYLLRFTGETIAGNNFNIRGLFYEHVSGAP